MALYLGESYIGKIAITTINSESTPQQKTVTPNATTQTIRADTGHILDSVIVNPIPSNYVQPSATKGATTYTPGTSNQTIAAGTYLSGVQTIKGDSNLIAANIKSGTTIFGITGNYTGSGSGSVSLQVKTNISPTEQSQTITPDSSYGGLSSVQINAIPGTYIGSQVPRMSGGILNPSEEQLLAVADGEVADGDVYIGAISSTYVGSGITRRSSTNLTASGATVTVPPGYYASQATKSVATGTAGTPTATKGTVSNHSISITPSVTNTTGYITGSTKTGTAVTVAASELCSGNKEITSNGTNIDVVGYSTISVTVSSSSSGKASQIAYGVGRVNTTSYTDVSGQSITVGKTGTYDVYWSGYRSSTSGTSGSQLYIDSTAYGSAQTAFNSSYGNCQTVHLTNVSLTQGQTITVRARARSTSYYMYIFNLTIIET